MPKTLSRRDSTLTKENQPNNHQIYLVQDIISPAYDQADKEYSKINVVGELSVTEETVSTSDYEVASGNNVTASDFQDAICGEPMKEQIIRLDFTPQEGIDDNEDVFKKCHGFWDFLKEHTELHHLRVVPEQHDLCQNGTQILSPPSLPGESIKQDVVKDEVKTQEMTATDWVNKKDIMSNAIRTLEQQRYCEHINDDYCDARASDQRDKMARKRKSRLASIAPLSSNNISGRSACRSRSVTSPQGQRSSLYDVEELMSQMKQWDLQHSRTLDPPHFPHALSHMTMLHSESVETDPETRKMSCCQLSCISECPSAAENTNTSAHDEAA